MTVLFSELIYKEVVEYETTDRLGNVANSTMHNHNPGECKFDHFLSSLLNSYMYSFPPISSAIL